MSKPYNPNTQGWGFALAVCVITAGLFGTAYTIHKNTYRHPRDPMATQVYSDRDAEKAAKKGDESHAADDKSHAADKKKDDH